MNNPTRLFVLASVTLDDLTWGDLRALARATRDTCPDDEKVDFYYDPESLDGPIGIQATVAIEVPDGS